MGVYNDSANYDSTDSKTTRGPMGFTGAKGEKGPKGDPGMTKEEIKDNIKNFLSNTHYVNPFAYLLGEDGPRHLRLTSSSSPVIFIHYKRGKNAANNKMYKLQTPFTKTGVTNFFSYDVEIDLPNDLPNGEYALFLDFYVSLKPDTQRFLFVDNVGVKGKGAPIITERGKSYNIMFGFEKLTASGDQILSFRLIIAYTNRFPSLTHGNMLRSWLSVYGTVGIPSVAPIGVSNNFFSVTRDGTSFSQNIINMGGRKIRNVGISTDERDVAAIKDVRDKETSILSVVNDKERTIMTKINGEVSNRKDEMNQLTTQHIKEIEKRITIRTCAILRNIEDRLSQAPVGKKVVLKMTNPGYDQSISGGSGGTILTEFSDEIDTKTLVTLSDPRSSFHLLNVVNGSPSSGIILEYSTTKDYLFTIEYEGLENANKSSAPSSPTFVSDEVRLALFTTTKPKRQILQRKFSPLPGERSRTFPIRRILPVGDDWVQVEVEAYFKRATSFKLTIQEK